ncbi:MAG: DegT/DnrJ/EryC1/StrS family aminotransferase [Acidobacteriota bacterium]
MSNFHTRLGYNWRMSEPHAIIGRTQLDRLEEFIMARNKIASIYDEGLQEIPGLTALRLPRDCRSNYYKYLALLDEGDARKAFKQMLREEFGIRLSGEVYDTPCHLQPIFAEFSEGDFPVATDICARQICLPVYAAMKDEEAHYVVESVAESITHLLKGTLV